MNIVIVLFAIIACVVAVPKGNIGMLCKKYPLVCTLLNIFYHIIKMSIKLTEIALNKEL